ncbi:hypothetical protein [Janthinobacterium agaricidamnosum]
MNDGHLTAWSHTQGAFPLRGDVALDAALLARAVAGHPVKVQWMRADEFGCTPFGPAMTTQIQAILSAERFLIVTPWLAALIFQVGIIAGMV